MRVLFSSDLHALRPVFQLFASTLAGGPFDAAHWPYRDLLRNIDGTRVDLRGWNFVGFSPTVGLSPHEGMQDETGIEALLEGIRKLVDRRTAFATHEPAARMPDFESSRHYGSEALRRFISNQRPRWHLFGHVHAGFGRRGRSVNGSYPRSRTFWDIDLETARAETRRARHGALPVPASASPPSLRGAFIGSCASLFSIPRVRHRSALRLISQFSQYWIFYFDTLEDTG
jgi:hypothetical protein